MRAKGKIAKDVTYWLRWFLLLPLVLMSFIITGITGCLFSMIVSNEVGILFVLPFCAGGWILSAFAIAPSHKKHIAIIFFILGGIFAAILAVSDPLQLGFRFLPFLLAGLGGVTSLWICLTPHPCKQATDHLARITSFSSISKLQNKIQGLSNQGEFIMNTNTHEMIRKLHIRIKRLAILGALVIGGCLLARGVIDIVPQDRQGLHMRLGRYVQTLAPGPHLKIPIIDRIIGVPVKERQGYIKHVDAMTEDNVIMKVSLQYTYEVTDPKRYRLEVYDAGTIIRELVQGRLRDVVNATSMNDIMKKRMELGQQIRENLAAKEGDFGIHFLLIQVQGSYPPPEVQEAIKQRMVTEQFTVAAREKATQTKITADAQLYQAQRSSEAAGFQIEETAKAQKKSIRMLLDELSKHEALGQKYLEYLISQELKENSKWIISGDTVPQMHLDG